MSNQRRRDTLPEVSLRRELHSLGLRFRVDRPVGALGRRRPDVVFGPARVAVFVDGCFWHRCPVHGSIPKSNTQWWAEKLATNVRRDRDTDWLLREAGWLAVRVWEHDDPAEAALRIRALVSARRSRDSHLRVPERRTH